MWLLFLLCMQPRKLYEKMALLKQLEYPGLQSYYKMKLLEENKHLFSSNDTFLDWNFE